MSPQTDKISPFTVSISFQIQIFNGGRKLLSCPTAENIFQKIMHRQNPRRPLPHFLGYNSARALGRGMLNFFVLTLCNL